MQEDNYPSLKNLKKLLILALLVVGCATIPKHTIGMTEEKFLEKHKKAELLEQDNYRTVYQLTFKGHSGQEKNYYLFDRGILVKVERAKNKPKQLNKGING